MKKICIYSLAIGIGLGIIITSAFNIIFIQSNLDYSKQHEIIPGQINRDTALNDGKKTLAKVTPMNDKLDESIDKGQNDSHIDIKPENNTEYDEIHILEGMSSEAIGKELEKIGVIDNKDEFNNLSIKLNASKKFQCGIKIIPKNSTIEEIITILTKKNNL